MNPMNEKQLQALFDQTAEPATQLDLQRLGVMCNEIQSQTQRRFTFTWLWGLGLTAAAALVVILSQQSNLTTQQTEPVSIANHATTLVETTVASEVASNDGNEQLWDIDIDQVDSDYYSVFDNTDLEDYSWDLDVFFGEG